MGKTSYTKRYLLKAFKFLILIYQYIFSPLLYFVSKNTIGGGCRFYPSCSEYCKLSVDKYGFGLKSFKLVTSRLLRCQPVRIFKNKKSYGYEPVE